MKTGFLFDLDGVLIDSETEYTRIWSEIDKAFPTGITDFARKIKGETLPKILNTYFPAELHSKVTAMLDSEEQRMRYNYMPGARELIDELKRNSLPFALVTSSNSYKMQHLEEELPGFQKEFNAVITADKVSKSKPDPEGYLLGAKSLGLPASRCVVFEDSLQGVKAGRKSGAFTVGLSTTLPTEIIAPWCDMIVSDLSEIDLQALIERISVHAANGVQNEN
ncbi:MAG: HAD-IA family hydrolase [Muribaculaceae bacterium]|nr:HAD-IA family hydrolase [Muribaculaceae bacterium]